ncbi:MAG: O-antigen ligase family protein [Acidobacteria bacterium]|nr:O-antigen ligase family protein [Acidobacteriota bacterium]
MRNFAFNLYLVFVAVWFTHLSERIAILGLVRVDLLLVASITGLILISRNDLAIPSPNQATPRTRKLIVVLLVYSIVVIPFVEWPGSVLNQGLPNFIKALVFYFFTAALVTSEQRLGRLLLVFVTAMTFRVLEPLYLHVTTGYWGSFAYMSGDFMNRLSGAPIDVINPNGLALVILTVIPFLHYLSPLMTLGRILYAAVLPSLLWALLLTGSRSGLLGLGAILLMIWLNSRRKILLSVAVVLAIGIVVPQLSADLTDRYRSIFDSKTKNAATAEGRIVGVERDLAVAMRRPFFGHGLGTSRETNANFGGEDQPSHDLYTEAAQEIGFVGLTILVVLIVSIASNLRAASRELKQTGLASPLLIRMNHAVQAWLAMNVLFSFASYGLSSYEWYFAAGLSEVTRRFAAELRTRCDTEVPVPRAPDLRSLNAIRRPSPAALIPTPPVGARRLVR